MFNVDSMAGPRSFIHANVNVSSLSKGGIHRCTAAGYDIWMRVFIILRSTVEPYPVQDERQDTKAIVGAQGTKTKARNQSMHRRRRTLTQKVRKDLRQFIQLT